MVGQKWVVISKKKFFLEQISKKCFEKILSFALKTTPESFMTKHRCLKKFFGCCLQNDITSGKFQNKKKIQNVRHKICLRVTVSILSGRFGAHIVVVEAWNFFLVLIKVSWVQKSIHGKPILKGKNRDFGTFFEILNFAFVTKAGSRDYQ